MTSAERDARIQAVALLSQMWALARCVDDALLEPEQMGFPDDYAVEAAGTLDEALTDFADDLMEPFDVCDVLQTVEEQLASGRDWPAYTDSELEAIEAEPSSVDPRLTIVRSLVEAREAARADEVTA